MIYPDEDMKRWECCDTQVVLANANYYYTKGQVDKKLDEIDGMTEEEVQTMINRSIRTKADKTDVNALSGQVEDNTEAIANTYTKREVDNAITAATAPVNNTLTAHTANTSVHVTSQEKTYWNNKLDASAYTPTDLSNYYTKQETQGVVNGAVSGKADTSAVTQEVSSAVAPLFGAVEYDSQTQRINFKHDATGQTIAYVDATDFIKDGMVSNVEIVNGNLVITFNSDAGKQPISIPLTDIFNPANYYTTAQTQSYVEGYTYDKATIDQKVAEGGTFDPDLYYDKTATDALLAAKADTATTYTKTEVDNALSSKADTSAVTAVSDALTAHTANTTVHVTSAEKTTWNNKSDFSGDYNDLTNKPTIPSKTSDLTNDSDFATTGDVHTATNDMATKTWVGNQGYLTEHQSLSNYYTKSETSGATEISTALASKQSTLESGINIKTINNESILGSGNITIEGGGSSYTAGDGIDITNDVISVTGKADTTAVTQVNDALTAHTANTSVHVTSAEKAEWNDKAEVIELTQAQYDALVTKDPDVLYVISDATAADITNYYTKAQTDDLLDAKADTATTYTKTEVDTALGGKQATLVSGTNIKTINNESILGEGNIEIQGGGATYTAGTNISIDTANTISCTLPITADSYNNITIGTGSSSSNKSYNVAIGDGATAGRNGWYGTAIAIGKSASAPRAISIAIGQLANADGGAGIAIGSQASTNITQGVAIGNQANATGTTKMNLNNQIKVDTNNQVYIKDKTNTTDVCIQDAIAALGGLKLVSLTQSEYDQLATKDSNTLYIINNVV